MPIEFYYIPESPPCRAVEMVAELLAISLSKHYVNLFEGHHLENEFLKLNPRHKVPFMIDGDVKIGESRAIIRYLVNKYNQNNEHLYPKDPIQRAYVDEILDFDVSLREGFAYRLFSPMYLGPINGLDRECEDKFKEALQYLDNKLQHNGAKKFLFGDNLTIADVSLAATLSYPGCFGYNMDGYEHITSYFDRLKAEIPKYSEINDQAVENLRKFVQSKL